jgi:hypothetical protein
MKIRTSCIWKNAYMMQSGTNFQGSKNFRHPNANLPLPPSTHRRTGNIPSRTTITFTTTTQNNNQKPKHQQR